MKFVLDVGVGRKVENYLRDEGHEVISILNENPSMKDDAILEIAVQAGEWLLRWIKILANWFFGINEYIKAFCCFDWKMQMEKKR